MSRCIISLLLLLAASLLMPGRVEAAAFDINAPMVEIQQTQACRKCHADMVVTYVGVDAPIQCPACQEIQTRNMTSELTVRVYQICPHCSTRMDLSRYAPGTRFRCGTCGFLQTVLPEAGARNTPRQPVQQTPPPANHQAPHNTQPAPTSIKPVAFRQPPQPQHTEREALPPLPADDPSQLTPSHREQARVEPPTPAPTATPEEPAPTAPPKMRAQQSRPIGKTAPESIPSPETLLPEDTEAAPTESADSGMIEGITPDAFDPHSATTDTASGKDQAAHSDKAEINALPLHGIAATVNGEKITRSSVDMALAAALEPIRQRMGARLATPGGIHQLQEERRRLQPKVLDQLIERTLVLDAARQEGISPDPQAVLTRAEALRQRDNTTPPAQVLEQARMGLILQAILKKHAQPVKTVTPAEIRAYYETHKKRFMQPERVRVKGLLIYHERVGRKDTRSARCIVTEISEHLKQGAAFATLVDRYSEYPHDASKGMLRMGAETQVPVSLLARPLQAHLKDTRPGESVGPVELAPGYAFFHLEERVAAAPRPLKELSGRIQRMLDAQARDTALRTWIDSLRTNASIQIH